MLMSGRPGAPLTGLGVGDGPPPLPELVPVAAPVEPVAPDEGATLTEPDEDRAL